MKAVILAAGTASRLRPLTDELPKCLLKAGKQTILERTVENLLLNHLDEIIIVTGFLRQKIRKYFNERFPGLAVTFINNEIYSSTNNIYSLWLAKDLVINDEMILLDSDIVFEAGIIEKLLTTGLSCIALKCYKVGAEEIKVHIDSTGRVLEISKEVEPSIAAGESIGIEVFRKDLLPELFKTLDCMIKKENKVNVFYETAFQRLINNKKDIFTVDISEYFCMEIDTAEDLKSADEYYRSKNR